MQLQSMILCGHNRAISLDATFGINDVKFHLFKLMVFDAHHIGVPMAWIITNKIKCEDLLEWLIPLRAKLLSHMFEWKPFCFIVDNIPQELWAL